VRGASVTVARTQQQEARLIARACAIMPRHGAMRYRGGACSELLEREARPMFSQPRASSA